MQLVVQTASSSRTDWLCFVATPADAKCLEADLRDGLDLFDSKNAVQGLVDVVVGLLDVLFLHEPAFTQLFQLFGFRKPRHFQDQFDLGSCRTFFCSSPPIPPGRVMHRS
jgi:hypothetical protein